MYRNWRLLLHDILDSCEKIASFTTGLSLADLEQDSRTTLAVERLLEIIGEAAKHLPNGILQRAQQIEWPKIKGMRDWLAHGYFAIKRDVLWKITQVHVPALRAAVGRLIEQVDASPTVIGVEGEVIHPLSLTYVDLEVIEELFQIPDVSQIDPKRQGGAVKLDGLLRLAVVKPTAKYLTLHASKDDFHASIPLSAVRDKAIVIYRMGDGPLPEKAGGPVRFFIPNFAACHTDEIDECANVKFVDRIELTAEHGRDNRPHDEKEHADLHERQS